MGKRLVLAAAMVALVAGCASPAHGRSAIGPVVTLPPDGSVTSTRPGPAPTAPAPGGPQTPSGHGGGPATPPPSGQATPPHGGGGPATSPSTKPSATPTGVITPPGISYRSDYSIRLVGHCFWILGSGQTLEVGATWEVDYTGLFAPDEPAVQWRMTDSVTSAVSGATVGVSTQVTGVAADTSPIPFGIFAGHPITLTSKIFPTGPDADAADNVARVTINVPTGSPAAGRLVTLPCHA